MQLTHLSIRANLPSQAAIIHTSQTFGGLHCPCGLMERLFVEGDGDIFEETRTSRADTLAASFRRLCHWPTDGLAHRFSRGFLLLARE